MSQVRNSVAMNRIRAAAWTLWTVSAILPAFVYAIRSYRFRRKLSEICRSIRAIDRNLVELQKLRDIKPKRDDMAVAERARREFEDVDFVAIADYLQLGPNSPGVSAD
jgi:beta-lactamase regulating signal transducer with metallopeptidase domain